LRSVSAVTQQSAELVFMLRPASFGFNAQTAATNAMQQPAAAPPGGSQAAAVAEFDSFVRQLRAEGVNVQVADDCPSPPRPDAVFPNNWISFHHDGTVVLYPLLAANRRLERREDLVARIVAECGFAQRRTLDLSGFEQQGRFLEGTGSLVLDHLARVAYAVPSPRTDPGLVRHWCREMSYECELFAALDAHSKPYYHSNVVLSIGTRFAVLTGEALTPVDRARVLGRLAASGRDVLDISRVQAAEFCANILELSTWDEALGDSSLLVMSRRARAAFTPEQFARLERGVDTVIAVPLDVIELIGGGGARCMLAEVFRP
jgi:hypothetical protein